MSRCVVWDVLISPLSLSLHSSGWGGKQSVPSPVAHNGEEFLASNRLAAGGRTNHFCSVSCEIKRLLIVFINQLDHQRWSEVQNLELETKFVTKSDRREERCSNYGDSSLSLSRWMPTCLNSAENSGKQSFHQRGNFTRERPNYNQLMILQPINLTASQPDLSTKMAN